ncbi:MAG: PriCT-2 domain-containing protein [Burkholderiales bacterium]
MVLMSGPCEAGIERWEQWSRRGQHYRKDDIRSVWRPISRVGGATLATLFYETRKHGFADPIDNSTS